MRLIAAIALWFILCGLARAMFELNIRYCLLEQGGEKSPEPRAKTDGCKFNKTKYSAKNLDNAIR